jgi:hypothetical protein
LGGSRQKVKKFEEYAFRFMFGLALLEVIATLYWLLVIGEYGLGYAVELNAGAEPPSEYRELFGTSLVWTATLNAIFSALAWLAFQRFRWALPVAISTVVFFVVYQLP